MNHPQVASESGYLTVIFNLVLTHKQFPFTSEVFNLKVTAVGAAVPEGPSQLERSLRNDSKRPLVLSGAHKCPTNCEATSKAKEEELQRLLQTPVLLVTPKVEVTRNLPTAMTEG